MDDDAYGTFSRRGFGISALALAGGVIIGGATTGCQAGGNGMETVELEDWGGPRLRAYIDRPAGWTPHWPILIAIHGANRNLDFTVSTWLPLARRYGFMVVMPHFTHQSFRGDRFALGGVSRGAPRDKSAFNAVEPLFDLVRKLTGATAESYGLFGHSAGAQFVERFLLFNPDARVDRVVMSMAGWYTLPEKRLPWPYGLGHVTPNEEDFARLVARECTLVLGALDDDPHAEQLRRTSLAQRQGAHRLERGLNFYAIVGEFARTNAIPMDWDLQILPDADHDSRQAAVAIAPWLARRGDQRFAESS